MVVKDDPQQRRRELLEELRKASVPLIGDLRAAGFPVAAVADIPRSGARASGAVPILIQAFHETPSRILKTEILRCLAKLPMTQESVRRLITEFEAIDAPSTDGV